jgi:thioredoxin family protein
MLDFKSLWDSGLTFAEFVAKSAEHKRLWVDVYRLARFPDPARVSLPEGIERKLLVLAEDWCGDASNTIPVLARWVEQTAGLELRIIRRDLYPEVMNRYLTNGARSIPIVIALDAAFQELGHWGPRPRELQAWVMENKPTIPKEEFYPQVRRWYAMDHGESTIREVMEAMGAVAPVAP